MADDPKPDDDSKGPEPAESAPTGTGQESNEAPDVDPPAWEGPEPDEGPKLVDPRPELPGPSIL